MKQPHSHAPTVTPAVILVCVPGLVALLGLLTPADAQENASTNSGTPKQTVASDGAEERRQSPQGLGGLPWAEGRAEIRPTRTRLPSPKKTLEIFEINETQLERFLDGEPFQSDDEEAMLRILYAIRRFMPEDIARWEKPVSQWTPLLESPDTMRTEFFTISGRVREITKQELLPEVARLFDYDHYYLVTFDVPDKSVQIRICCLEVPKVWLETQSLNERCTAPAMFLKAGGKADGVANLIFAAPRIAWLPDSLTEIASVSPSEVMLADLGVDIGALSQVRDRNGRGMGVADRDPFYQLLAKLPEASPERMQRLNRPFSLSRAIQTPKAMHGAVCTVRGRARRITRVLVGESEPDIRERFGIDHYYLIDFFIPLGDLSLQLRGAEGDAASPVYQNGFPAVACVRELPEELEALHQRLLDGSSGQELLNEDIELTGVFFRLWSYRSAYVDEFDPNQRQISPMFLASSPRLIKSNTIGNPYLGTSVAIFFLGALAAIWLIVWRSGKSDAEFQKETVRRRIVGDEDEAQVAARLAQIEVPELAFPEPTFETRTYRSDSQGFSFEYPEDWQIDAEGESAEDWSLEVRMTGPKTASGIRPALTVETQAGPVWTEQELAHAEGAAVPSRTEFSLQTEKEIRENLPEVDLIESSECELGSQPAQKFVYAFHGPAQRLLRVRIVRSAPDHSWRLTWEAPERSASGLLAAFESLVASFRDETSFRDGD